MIVLCYNEIGMKVAADAKTRLLEALDRSIAPGLVTTTLNAIAGLTTVLEIEGQHELSAAV